MFSVWNYAQKRKNPVTKEVEAVCNRCSAKIKCSRGSTTTLKNHLITQHQIEISEPDKQLPQASHTKKPKIESIDTYFHRRKLHEIVSDLATDGASIRFITRNKYIRESITRDGFKLPANESDVMMLVHKDFDEKKQQMKNTIKAQIDQGGKFCLSFDEFTSLRRRRYIGINIHSSIDNKTYKLGIVRIVGSCPAETLAQLIEDHLFSFGLSLTKDIVGSTQDGAYINKKFIKLTKIIDQFCLNHAIHLAVVDCLYKKKYENNEPEEDCDDESDDDFDDDFDDSGDFQMFQEEKIEEIDHNENLKNARKVVKFIKYSTVRDSIFQSKVLKEFGKEIELSLDVKHRWNSLPAMITRMLKTKKCLFETFSELNAIDMINSVDFEMLESLQLALDPIKIAVEILSAENSNLISATKIVDFLLNKLSSQNNKIAIEMHRNLKKRLDERLNKEVLDLLKCLKDSSLQVSKSCFAFASKLAYRLFGMNEVQCSIDSGSNSSQTQESFDELSLKEQFYKIIEKDEDECSLKSDDFKWLKQEFALFQKCGKRTENLDKLYHALLALKPTSTDVERVFSICNNFCTKIRSRLSDKSLNSLVFLKFFYGKK